MALNQNHTVEELGGTRCSIVEKGISEERVKFLTALLNGNGYTVVCAPAATPEHYTLGVTDLMFNPTNAIYGRILRTHKGDIVSAAYWLQQEQESNLEVPYFLKHTNA